MEEDGSLLNSFCETSIVMISTRVKDTIKNYRHKSLRNLHVSIKLLNERCPNRIEQHIKSIMHYDQVGFIPGGQGWLDIGKLINVICSINRIKGKKHRIISIDVIKALDKM